MGESSPPAPEQAAHQELDAVVIAFATRVERLRREMQGLREQLEQMVASREGPVAAGGGPR